MTIDTSFDFRNDTPDGKDPDACSPTLRSYHKLLWSKALPGGAHFTLDDTRRRTYLHHSSTLGEFFLASDSVVPTYTRWGFAHDHPLLVPEAENKAFMALTYTIGGMMVFPGDRVAGKWTINQARGCIRKISDRFDLTLECIRRHYLGQASPLAETLARYPAFFGLFGDFRGYVEFFLLQDLVNGDASEVAVFPPFDDFKGPAVPQDLTTYQRYRERASHFVRARNRRIDRYTAELSLR
jgi:hypothetical protein